MTVGCRIARAATLLLLALVDLSTSHTIRAAGQGSPTTLSPPKVMHFCAANCMTLTWDGEKYVRTTPWYPWESNDSSSVWTLQLFTRELVIIHRVETHDGKVAMDATFRGQISPEGNSLVNVSWNGNPAPTVRLTWGTALDATPGDNSERDRRKQIQAEAGGAAEPALHYEAFSYPGTDYQTRLVAINNQGIALGSFKVTRESAPCDTHLFGGPCPTMPGDYPFLYDHGKFTRIQGSQIQERNLRPIAINDRGIALIGNTFGVFYDVKTATARPIGTLGNPGITGSTVKMLVMLISGLNNKGEISGVANLNDTMKGIPLPNRMAYGVPSLGLPGWGDAPETERTYVVYDAPVPCRSKVVGDVVYTGLTDSGHVLVSCEGYGAIYDIKAQKAAVLSGPRQGWKFTAINNNDEVIGCTGSDTYINRAGTLKPLPLPTGSCALGLNDRGEFVGENAGTAFIATPAAPSATSTSARAGDSQGVGVSQAAPVAEAKSAGWLTNILLVECEEPKRCDGHWIFHELPSGLARWDLSGARANLTILQISDDGHVVIERKDVGNSSSPGLTAIYRGVVNNHVIEGQVEWSWPGHWAQPVKGHWFAAGSEAELQPVLASYPASAASNAFSSPSDTRRRTPYQTTISINLTEPWTDTGIYLSSGQTATIAARGTMNWFTGACNGHCLSTPAGISCPGGAPKRLGLTCLSLIGKVGAFGEPFDVGENRTLTAAVDGELFLGVNDDNLPDNTGRWEATISAPKTAPR